MGSNLRIFKDKKNNINGLQDTIHFVSSLLQLKRVVVIFSAVYHIFLGVPV